MATAEVQGEYSWAQCGSKGGRLINVRPRAESKGPIPLQPWGMLRLLAEGSTNSFVTLLL